MDVGHALDTANAHAFQEQFQDGHGPVRGKAHCVQGPFVLFGEGLAALVAVEPL